MTARIIPIASWERACQYMHFKSHIFPYYNVTLSLDVSGLKAYSRNAGLRLNSILLYAALKAINSIPQFRIRPFDDTHIQEVATIHGSTTHLDPGSQLFRLIAVPYIPNIYEFCEEVERQKCTRGFYGNTNTSDAVVYFSPTPWYTFSGITHAMQGADPDNATPLITWGAIECSGGAERLPFNICVNHRYIDALHLSMLFKQIETIIKDLNFTEGTKA